MLSGIKSIFGRKSVKSSPLRNEKDIERIILEARKRHLNICTHITLILAAGIIISALAFSSWITITWHQVNCSATDKGILPVSNKGCVNKRLINIPFIDMLADRNISYELLASEILTSDQSNFFLMKDREILGYWSEARSLVVLSITCSIWAIVLNCMKLCNKRERTGTNPVPTIFMFASLVMAIIFIIWSQTIMSTILGKLHEMLTQINQKYGKHTNLEDFDVLCVKPPSGTFFLLMSGLFFLMVTLVLLMDYYDPA